MQIRFWVIFFTFLFLQSCSSDDDQPLPPSPPEINSNPGELKIESINFIGKQVTIDWNDVIDDNKDKIYYTLYIDSKLIGEFIESVATTELQYNSSFEGRIIATDKRGGNSEVTFSFSSPKSKIIFFNSGEGLIAYDLITNKILWKSESFISYAHTIYQNRIFTGINSLNILTGEILSTLDKIDNDYRDIIVDENYIYAIGTGSGSKLFSFDLDTGNFNWEISFLNVYAPLSLDENSVFVSSRNNDFIYSYNKIDGEFNWSFGLDPNNTGSAPRVDTNPLISDENIYFGDNIGRFYSLNKNTGTKNWSVNAGLFNSFYGSPVQNKNNIIVGTDNFLYSYMKNDGRVNWSYSMTGYSRTSPYIYGERVYLGISDNRKGHLVCINVNTGIENWKFELDDDVVSSPVVYEDKVYIGDIIGNFYVINAINGVLEWKVKIGESQIASPTIVVGNGEEVVYPSVHGLKN